MALVGRPLIILGSRRFGLRWPAGRKVSPLKNAGHRPLVGLATPKKLLAIKKYGWGGGHFVRSYPLHQEIYFSSPLLMLEF